MNNTPRVLAGIRINRRLTLMAGLVVITGAGALAMSSRQGRGPNPAPAGQYVYVTSYASSAAHPEGNPPALHVFRQDRDTGDLTLVQQLDGPSPA